MPKKLAIVAALAREVAPLVEAWHPMTLKQGAHEVRVYVKGDILVAHAGIGPVAARAACEALWEHAVADIGMFVSAGYAGALRPEMKIGHIVKPRHIVLDRNPLRTELYLGEGTLVSTESVASPAAKRELAQKHSANAVDMEAHAVADFARGKGVPCIAIKAVSDEHDTELPPVHRFVDPAGRFRQGGFVLHVAVRPWLWRRVIRLGRHTAQASRALAEALRETIAQHGRGELYNRAKDTATT